MNNQQNKGILDFFESCVLDLPHLLGLPVPDKTNEDYSKCFIQFYLSLAIICCSFVILLLPRELAQITHYIFGFYSGSSLLGKTVGSLTSNFVHADFQHLIGNIYFFLIFAPLVEKKYGQYNFLIVFLVCSLSSSFGTLFFMKNNLSIGVSGTLAGFMGLIATAEPKLQFRMYKIFIVPCWSLILVLFFIPDLLSILAAKRTGVLDHVNHYAHLFGFMSGSLLSFIITPIKEKERSLQINYFQKINLEWLNSTRLWPEIFLGIIIPFFVFYIHEKSTEKFLFGLVNCYLYCNSHVLIAITWAVIYVFLVHKDRYELEKI